jgi:putative endonuclease
MTRGLAERRRARSFGLESEWFAGLWLRLKGYSILARQYSVKGGEIDLIVRRGATIAFVEVKARSEIGVAETAIDARKVERIARAARHWIVRNPYAMQRHLRGDAIYLAPGRLPRHVADAYIVPIDLYERGRP